MVYQVPRNNVRLPCVRDEVVARRSAMKLTAPIATRLFGFVRIRSLLKYSCPAPGNAAEAETPTFP